MNLYSRYQNAEQQLVWHQHTPGETAQPDPASPTRPRIFVRDHNLWVESLGENAARALTTEGEPHFGYGTYSDFYRVGLMENTPQPPAVCWSDDGRYLAVQRIDERKVNSMPLQHPVPIDGSIRPQYSTYKMALPGDTYYPQASLCVIDMETGRIIPSNRPPQPASLVGPMETGAARWGADNKLYVIELDRSRQTVRLSAFDPVTASSDILVEETGEGNLYPGPIPLGEPVFALVPEHDSLLWYSHRNGWGQLHRYCLSTGEYVHALSPEGATVTQIQAIDKESGTLFFSVCGVEAGRNPYYEHLYRVNLDGTSCELLTPEDAQHDIVSLDVINKTFVDRFSRVDLPTTQCVRTLTNGAIIETPLDQAESSSAASTFNHPIDFTAKAADQHTDLYGVIYRPSDFIPSKTYPVILAIYGTPHECIVPRRYADTSNKVRDCYRTLAELGFVVVMMDPRGTPLRGKTFHDMAYGNLHNGGGIEDQVAVLQQLAERYPWMDKHRIGITGHSGGGFASARAMMTHGDIFKVCVASAGNHDQRLYAAGWMDTFQGLLDDHNTGALSYQPLIKNLRGKLLLVHGDADANVPLAQTLQLANALIANNKSFDLLVLPNRGHLHAQDTYFIRRLWDYFVEHLLGDTPPEDYAITPPND